MFSTGGNGRILERYKNVASCMDIVGNGVVCGRRFLYFMLYGCVVMKVCF